MYYELKKGMFCHFLDHLKFFFIILDFYGYEPSIHVEGNFLVPCCLNNFCYQKTLCMTQICHENNLLSLGYDNYYRPYLVMFSGKVTKKRGE